MIFVSGVHGVGKSFFCDRVESELGIKSYSASQLITEKRKRGFELNKYVPDIEDNQPLLIEALNELRHEGEFILDGHFCLLDAEGNITRISLETYFRLSPDAMILLTEKPEVIAVRRERRDGIKVYIRQIDAFQNEERAYAKEIAAQLGVPLFISEGSEYLQQAITFIRGGN